MAVHVIRKWHLLVFLGCLGLSAPEASVVLLPVFYFGMVLSSCPLSSRCTFSLVQHTAVFVISLFAFELIQMAQVSVGLDSDRG